MELILPDYLTLSCWWIAQRSRTGAWRLQ